MNLTYQNNTLYIDLIGNINVEEVTSKVSKIKECYNFKNFVLNTEEAFISDYKRAKLKKNILTDINIK